MHMLVVTQYMEIFKKHGSNDVERMGKNKASNNLEEWISTCYHGGKHDYFFVYNNTWHWKKM